MPRNRKGNVESKQTLNIWPHVQDCSYFVFTSPRRNLVNQFWPKLESFESLQEASCLELVKVINEEFDGVYGTKEKDSGLNERIAVPGDEIMREW
jgi:hypothetical protein